jgi:hypothetical protein
MLHVGGAVMRSRIVFPNGQPDGYSTDCVVHVVR